MRGFTDICAIVRKSTLEIGAGAKWCLCSCIHLCNMTVDGAAQQKLIVSNVTSLSPPPQAGSPASRLHVCVYVGDGEKDKRTGEFEKHMHPFLHKLQTDGMYDMSVRYLLCIFDMLALYSVFDKRLNGVMCCSRTIKQQE